MSDERRVLDVMNVYTAPLLTMSRAQEQLVECNQRTIERSAERQAAASRIVRAGVESVRATQTAGIEVARAMLKLSTVGADDAVDEAFDGLRANHDALFAEYELLLETALDAGDTTAEPTEAIEVTIEETADATEDAVGGAMETADAAEQEATPETRVSGNAADEAVSEATDVTEEETAEGVTQETVEDARVSGNAADEAVEESTDTTE